MELTPTISCPQCGSSDTKAKTCSTCGFPLPSSPPTQSPALSPSHAEEDLPTSLPSQSIHDHETLQSSGTPVIENLSLGPTPDSTDLTGPPQAESHSSPPSISDSSVYHPLFWGSGKTLFGIFIVNTFYTLITLGIYSFWGRVRIREYLYSQTSLAKIRFSYHGTGLELLKGWTKALAIFGIPYGFLNMVPIIWENIPVWIPNLLAFLMAICFIPVAIVGSHRYRLSRTSFGSIRFSFRGRVRDYLTIWIRGTFLSVLTAGAYYPFFEHARRHFLVTFSHLGNRHFRYDGTGTGLLGIYLKTIGIVFLIIFGVLVSLVQLTDLHWNPEISSNLESWAKANARNSWFPIILFGGTFMLIIPWFFLQVSKQRYFWNHTMFNRARFQFTASTWNLIELRVTNFFMLILSFGLAWPWVQVRNLQFFYYYLVLRGPLETGNIHQEALDASPTGEELAGYFDAGFDLG